MYTKSPGSDVAKAFIARYPTPKALRDAWDHDGAAVITEGIKALLWAPDCTIGQVMRDGLRREDLRSVHHVVAEHARDVEIWTSPDGAQTVMSHHS